MRIVSDSEKIVKGDDRTCVESDLHVIAEKTANVRVNDKVEIQIVDGDVSIVVNKGNVNLRVENGNVDSEVTGNIEQYVTGNIKEVIAGSVKREVRGNYILDCDGTVTIKGSSIHLN